MLMQPTMLGTIGTLNPPAFSARHSSQTPTQTAAVARTTNVHFGTKNSVTTTAAPSDRPTVNAAGRLRPARETLTDWASVVTGATTAPCGSSEAVAGSSVMSRAGTGISVGRSDREELALLALEQRVDRVDVLLGHRLQLLLAPDPVVLADLAVPDQLVEVGLGLAAQVADRDPGLLGLVVRQLDVLLAPVLGEDGQDAADDVAVVARV